MQIKSEPGFQVRIFSCLDGGGMSISGRPPVTLQVLTVLSCGDLGADFRCDVPDIFERGPGTQNEQRGNQHTDDLQTENGAGGLYLGSALIAAPAQSWPMVWPMRRDRLKVP